MTGSTMLEVGDTAPDFELRGVEDGEMGTYRLSEYTDQGNWVFLTFYAFDFNPICTEGMCALRDAEFFEYYEDMAMLGISGDGVHSHDNFATQHNINYPLLSDTGKDVAERYGVVREEMDGMRRVHQRAVFIIDDTQTIRFVAAIEADSPEDMDLTEINEVVRDLRA